MRGYVGGMEVVQVMSAGDESGGDYMYGRGAGDD